MIDFRLQKFAWVALAAAALFGISTPLAKIMLGDLPALGLAGLLYLGSGAGLLLVWLLRRAGRDTAARSESALTARDWPWLFGAVAAGGVIAPVLLLWGLRGTGAAAASLLLNLEGALTTLIAALLFREAVGARIWFAILVMAAAGAMLGWRAGGGGWSPQSLAIAGACAFWALDNNLTRKVSGSDPSTIAMIKGLVAGTINTTLAVALGMTLPATGTLIAALLLGFLSYGVSLVLFIHALRHLGSARATAHFGTAPFIGAALAVLLLGEPLTPLFAAALSLMAIAAWLVLSERHGHRHQHSPLVHSHRHVHDAHHQHAHDGSVSSDEDEGHAHRHEHSSLTHTHAHLPDLHHRHRH
ncbi:MAG: DMT family transporter [Betaproteobacteria bacterium]